MASLTRAYAVFCTDMAGPTETANVWVPRSGQSFPFLKDGEHLFVRKCYETLWAQVFTCILPGKELGVSDGALILGTPGIGKSCFLNYALVRLLELPPADRPTIVLDVPGLFARITPDGTVTHGQADQDFKAELKRKSTLYMYDARELCSPQPTGGPVLATSSPNRKQYKPLDTGRIRRLFMPVWSLEELETYRQFSKTSMWVACRRVVLMIVHAL